MNVTQDPIARNEELRAALAATMALISERQAQEAVLTQEVEQARAQLAELDSATAALAVATAERDRLLAENVTLRAKKADFDKRLSAELSKHGIRFFN